MKIFWAIFGIFRHEIIYELKSGLFLGALVLPVIFTVIFGFAIGFQGVPPKDLPVGVYQESGITLSDQPLLNTTENILVERYASVLKLEEAIDDDLIVVGLAITRNSTGVSFRIIQD